MIYFYRTIFISVITLNFTAVYAQINLASIKGRITDSEGRSLESATVLLIRLPDSALVSSGITDKAGIFRFTITAFGKYLVETSIIGYRTKKTGPFNFNTNIDLDLGNVKLDSLPTPLDEINVVKSKPLIDVKPGMVILNVDNSIISSDNSAYDIIKRAPGIQINGDEISLRGKTSTLIMIDGKPLYIDSGTAYDLLQNLPGTAIDRIELISNPGAKYDSGGSGGIINIWLKKGKTLGSNGSFNAGAGYGKNYKTNAGINYNYRMRKFNFFGIYNYGNNKRLDQIDLGRSIHFQNVLTDFAVTNNDLKKLQHNNYKLGLDYYLTPNSTIGLAYSGFYNTLSSDEKNRSIISNNSKTDSIIATSSLEKRHTGSHSFNLNYSGKLKKIGEEITADLDYLKYNRNSLEMLSYEYFTPQNMYYKDPVYYQNTTPADFDIRSATVNYSYPFSQSTKLDLGAKSSRVKSFNDRRFEQVKDQALIYDASISNQFEFKEQINAAYFNLSGENKKSSFDIGLRAEQTITRGSPLNSSAIVRRNYIDFFPNLQWTRTIDKSDKLLFSYSRRIERPAYEDLNPFLYFLDRYNYREGNPYLKPEYSNTFEITHTFKQKYNTTLRYTYVKDAIFIFTEQNDTSKVLKNMKKNFNNSKSIGLEFNVPVTYTKWWAGNINVQGYQLNYTYTDNVTLNNPYPYLELILNNQFKVKDQWAAELNFNYQSSETYGIYNFKPVYILDAGIGRSLLNKKANIRLALNDIFNSGRYQYSTRVENLDYHSLEKTETRILRLNFVYRFGRGVSFDPPNRKSGNEEESKRLKN